jgi:hypothetical protein
VSAGIDVAVRGTVRGSSAGLRARAGGVLRSAALWVVAAVVVLLAAIVMVLMQGREAVRPLHYDSTQPDGGRAFTEVLRAQGREVTTTESLAEAREAAAGGGTLLVYAAGDVLDPEIPGELMAAADEAGTDVVLIAPDLTVSDWTDALETDYLGEVSPDTRRAPECEVPEAQTAGAVSSRAAGADYYSTSPEPEDVEFCYPGTGTGAIDEASVPHGLYAVEDRGASALTVLGAEEWLSNETLADEGHMSLVAGAVAGDGELTYYYPDSGDQPRADDEQLPIPLMGLFPDWAVGAVLWLLPVALVAMLVYGRRLGPLAVEPLPVVVPAAETVLGRSALLQRAQDRETALRDLRAAALVRLGRRLALGPETPAAEVCARAAAAAGLDPAWTEAVLLTQPAGDDATFVRLSADITSIEREVDLL